MKSCLIVLLVVVYVAAAVAEAEKCFKEGEMEKMKKEKMEKMNAPVVKKCKEEKPETASDEAKMKECVKGEWTKAKEECKGEEDKKKQWACASKKLGVEFKMDAMKLEEYKTKLLNSALPEKKATIEAAIKPCEEKKGHEAFFCAIKSIRKECSDFSCGRGGKGGKGGKGKNEDEE